MKQSEFGTKCLDMFGHFDLPLLGGRTNILRSEFGHPVHAVSCGDDIDSCRGGVADWMILGGWMFGADWCSSDFWSSRIIICSRNLKRWCRLDWHNEIWYHRCVCRSWLDSKLVRLHPLAQSCTKCRICTEEMAWTMVTGWRFCWNPGVCCSFKAGSAWSSTDQEHPVTFQ